MHDAFYFCLSLPAVFASVRVCSFSLCVTFGCFCMLAHISVLVCVHTTNFSLLDWQAKAEGLLSFSANDEETIALYLSACVKFIALTKVLTASTRTHPRTNSHARTLNKAPLKKR